MIKKLLCVAVLSVLMIFVAGYALAKDGGKNKGMESGNTVSQAAHEAQAEGLKGQDLAGKVHEAIDERKESKEGTEKAETGKDKHPKYKNNKKGGQHKGRNK